MELSGEALLRCGLGEERFRNSRESRERSVSFIRLVVDVCVWAIGGVSLARGLHGSDLPIDRRPLFQGNLAGLVVLAFFAARILV